MDRREEFFREKEKCREPLAHIERDIRRPDLKKADEIYAAADHLSMRNAEKYRRILLALSVAGTLLAVAFLLYDEINLYGLILACGVLLLTLFIINGLAKRLHCHRNYLEYRLLAEGARVQYFLCKAKSRQTAADLLPWSWCFNVPWTEPVLRELGRTVDGAPENSSPAEAAAGENVADSPAAGKTAAGRTATGEAAAEKNPRGGDSCRSRYRILDVWVRGQAQYHREALIMTEARIRRNDRISNLALLLALATYAAALVFEICVGGLFSGSVLLGQRQMEVIRVILKVAMGSFSAMTLFAGNYYGKLSLEETAQDHRRMAALYEKTEEEILRTGETEDLITKLAREELSENSSWYAYQCKNRPDISL